MSGEGGNIDGLTVIIVVRMVMSRILMGYFWGMAFRGSGNDTQPGGHPAYLRFSRLPVHLGKRERHYFSIMTEDAVI